MKTPSYMDAILSILHQIKEDEESLQKVLAFLGSEILPSIQEVENEIQLPEQFEELVRPIGQSLVARFVVYLNLDTLETEEDFHGIMQDEWRVQYEEEFAPKHNQWTNVLTIEPLESHESFRMMESFAESLEDVRISQRLIEILNRKKPFGHFNHYIHNSPYREDWFAFRDKAYERHVRGIIEVHLKMY